MKYSRFFSKVWSWGEFRGLRNRDTVVRLYGVNDDGHLIVF